MKEVVTSIPIFSDEGTEGQGGHRHEAEEGEEPGLSNHQAWREPLLCTPPPLGLALALSLWPFAARMSQGSGWIC